MDINKWLSAFIQFLVLLPSAASCYYTMKNQMKHSWLKTTILWTAVLVLYSFLGACLCTILQIDVNTILLPSLVLFFFLFHHSVTASIPKCLAVYVGVCAVQTFPAQFAYFFDSFLYPESGAADFSIEGAFFQLGLSCFIAAAFAWPACLHFYQMVDCLDSSKIWYSTIVLSSIFLIMNVFSIPKSYSTLHTRRIVYIFPLLECCSLAVLVTIYLLFYYSTKVILEHAKLKERSQLLEMQAHQYQTLQEYIRQTAQLRHDFRHSIRLISSLAEKGDINSIQTHLAGYEIVLKENIHTNYCANAAMNALFGYYYELAVSANIDTNWHIELPNPLPAAELDMASIFGNLIENAIDGCLTMPENSRHFCLTTETRHGNRLYIVSTNSFNGKVKKSKDGYHSTKHDGNGIGLTAIAATAEKYGGSAKVSNSDTEFFVDVVLKI